MDYKNLLKAIGFSPKENAVYIFSKKYQQADNYCIEVDFEKQTINYGDKIQSDSKTTQNFLQPENFVVLECVINVNPNPEYRIIKIEEELRNLEIILLWQRIQVLLYCSYAVLITITVSI